jgi:hypothetical protein
MAITPRHYLDFINHYANLFHEKRSELEEQQMHLNVGLRKIKETVDQVEQQQQPRPVPRGTHRGLAACLRVALFLRWKNCAVT